MKSRYCRIGTPVTKSSSRQTQFELAAAGLVEHQLAERGVVAEITLHQVEPGRERPSLRTPLEIEIRGAVRNEEGVGEYAAKLLDVGRGFLVGSTHPAGGEPSGPPEDERLTAGRNALGSHLSGPGARVLSGARSPDRACARSRGARRLVCARLPAACTRAPEAFPADPLAASSAQAASRRLRGTGRSGLLRLQTHSKARFGLPRAARFWNRQAARK